jgi:anaerobic ribonucleoside-triphosphate reductase activating protein
MNIWCYTGYTYEQLMFLGKSNKHIMNFLSTIDVLVDGKFILEEKSQDAIFRGSKNQRIIDVKKSLKKNKVCLVEKYILKEEKVKYRFCHEEYLFV